jgi:hypothetical protein
MSDNQKFLNQKSIEEYFSELRAEHPKANKRELVKLLDQMADDDPAVRGALAEYLVRKFLPSH